MKFTYLFSGAPINYETEKCAVPLITIFKLEHLVAIEYKRFIYETIWLREKGFASRKVYIEHQCRETTVLSCHRCLISSGVKKMNNI
jgi:hypothetical protein